MGHRMIFEQVIAYKLKSTYTSVIKSVLVSDMFETLTFLNILCHCVGLTIGDDNCLHNPLVDLERLELLADACKNMAKTRLVESLSRTLNMLWALTTNGIFYMFPYRFHVAQHEGFLNAHLLSHCPLCLEFTLSLHY